MKNLRKIQDQVIVITGASSGIGLATAKLAAKKGAKVVLASRNLADLEHVTSEIRRAGGRAIAVGCDVKKLEDLRNLRDRAIEAYGTIDTWVNNAGVSLYGPLMKTNIEEDREGRVHGRQKSGLRFKRSFWTALTTSSWRQIAFTSLVGLFLLNFFGRGRTASLFGRRETFPDHNAASELGVEWSIGSMERS